jgi:hypothetical protein
MFQRLVIAMLLFLTALLNAGEKGFVSADPGNVDADYPIQGEYAGELNKDVAKAKYGVHVIARGGGKFHAVLYTGGLPGDGYDRSKTKEECDGATADGVTSFTSPSWTAKIKDSAMTVASTAGQEMGQLKRIVRESPTIGLKPPEGAVVLFDGSNVDEWQKGARMTEDKLLMEGVNSVKKFGSCSLHVEFRLPYMPNASGQGRGNSGCYLQSRYETQILDSFGLAGKNNECGGVYTIAEPIVNMCFPPLQWQTYDIDYIAATFEDGKKVKNAVLTVKHNGILVQDKTELTKNTTSSPLGEGPEPGPLHLQNHGNPVRFRNIWILEKK